MSQVSKYFSDIFGALRSLITGMKVTGYYFVHPKEIVTQQYPENRVGKNSRTKEKLVMFDRFKGEIIMPHNEKNEHKCTGCGICQINCPNGTIKLITKTEVIDGKNKKAIDKHIYNLSMCTFCGLCVKTCPSKALDYGQQFEHAVFERNDMIKILNKEGSVVAKDLKEKAES